MVDKSLGTRIQEIAIPIATALDLELVEVLYQGRGSKSVIRVTIDKVDGVGISDCEQFHHSFSKALDVADPLPYAYRLEVSSPGLDRPLLKPEDYQRVVGKLVRVKLREPLSGEWLILGRLSTVMDTGIEVMSQQGKTTNPVNVPWEIIAQAKLEIEF
ncbi:MAG: ribosome maturation factor RimP [Nitrospirae bacterium]|nr:ribosome maturation factor RimP [Nitrospirota bacterium]